MNVYAVRTNDGNDTLVMQFENKVDARAFVRIYSCNLITFYMLETAENPNHGLFTHLPSDSICRAAIQLYTGVRL